MLGTPGRRSGGPSGSRTGSDSPSFRGWAGSLITRYKASQASQASDLVHGRRVEDARPLAPPDSTTAELDAVRPGDGLGVGQHDTAREGDLAPQHLAGREVHGLA